MKIAIIEDEIPAKKHLISLIGRVIPGVEVVFEAQSIKGALAELEGQEDPDLIFMDIQLNDGLSFEIFDYVRVKAPVIFTTAFDQYMLEAFQSNGIDYLLKPIRIGDLEKALEKYQRLGSHFGKAGEALQSFAQHQRRREPLSRVIAKKGVNFKSLPVEDIAYLLSEQKVTFLVDRSGSKYLVDAPLADLEVRLGDAFFRLNRKFLASRSAIDQFRSAGQGRIAVDLTPDPKEEVQVSQEKAGEFREWIGR